MINVSFQIMVSRIIELVPHRHISSYVFLRKLTDIAIYKKIKIITKQPDKKLY